jgi:hypothetical protein
MAAPLHTRRVSAVARLLSGRARLAVSLALTTALAAYLIRSLWSWDLPPTAADFYLYYLAGQVGRAHGFAHMYDPAVFLPALQASSGRFMPYLNPPPLAGLVLALTFLPYRWALVVWVSVLVAALVFAWRLVAPGTRLVRVAHLTAVAALLPVLFGLWLGQATFLVIAAVALCWWFLQHGRPTLAGVALAGLALKPQVAILVPPALLLAGYGRVFFSWAAATLVLVVASLLLIGADGVQYYRQAIEVVYQLPGLKPDTLAGVLGLSLAGRLAAALAAGVALFTAWRARGAGPEWPIAAALIGSVLASPYLNVYDLTALVLAGWLVLRTEPPLWQKLLLLPGYALFALATGGSAPVVIFACAWALSLLGLAGGRRPAPSLVEPAALSLRGTPGSRARRVVVLPAYHAEKTLRDVVAQIPRGEVDRILLVDDASSDRTAELAMELGIDVIQHPSNLGYGGNQKTCYANALLMGAEVVVMLHPDGQYDPGLVPALCRAVESGRGDVALGSRWLGLDPAHAGMPRWKRAGNRLLTGAENWVLGLRLSEYHTGYRAYSRRFLETVPFPANSNDFVFDTQILLQAARFGFRVAEIPAVGRYFPDASSIGFGTSVRYGLQTLAALASYLADRGGIPCAWLTPRRPAPQRRGRLAA